MVIFTEMPNRRRQRYSAFNFSDIAKLHREVQKITARSGTNAARKLAKLKAAIDRLEDKVIRRGGGRREGAE